MRRHDFDGLSFAFGLFFAAVGLLLVGGATFSDRFLAPWTGPVLLIVLAIVIVIAARPKSSANGNDSGEPGDTAELPAG